MVGRCDPQVRETQYKAWTEAEWYTWYTERQLETRLEGRSEHVWTSLLLEGCESGAQVNHVLFPTAPISSRCLDMLQVIGEQFLLLMERRTHLLGRVALGSGVFF